MFLLVFSALFAGPIAAQDKNDPGSAKDKKAQDATKNSTKDSTKDSKKDSGEKPATLEDAGILFPDIEDWTKSEVVNYPDPSLGYSVGYSSTEGGRVTIYVYNGGLKNISADLSDKAIREQIERAKNELVEAGKAGYYTEVKEIKNDTVTLGGASGKVKALRSLFHFKVRGTEVDSEIYLFSYKNNFIKIRATRPKAPAGKENAVFQSFLAEIDALFAK
jgi:hypothetical protein